MDFKKLAIFIIILGFLVAGYGGYKLNSLYKTCDDAFFASLTSENGRRVRIYTQEERQRFRDDFLGEKRSEPTIFLATGGIIMVIGIAVMVSAQKK